MHPSSLFSLSDHLARLSNDGDPREVLEETADFERFRDLLVDGLGCGDGAKGGHPPFDPVSMFKVLVVQAQHNLSDARMEFGKARPKAHQNQRESSIKGAPEPAISQHTAHSNDNASSTPVIAGAQLNPINR